MKEKEVQGADTDLAESLTSAGYKVSYVIEENG
jgi:hypothetical protein